MNLLVRINLALAVAFTLAALAVGGACSAVRQENAKPEALRAAGLMMDSALSIRAQPAAEIVSLLNVRMEKEFLAQSVPSYAATQNFLHLRDKRPEYACKEATLNPTHLLVAAVAPSFNGAQLQLLEWQLAHDKGPVAQHLVRRAAARGAGWEQLIRQLAGEIEAAPARRQFVDACRTLGRQSL